MDKSLIIQRVQEGQTGCELFADALLQAKQIRTDGHEYFSGLTGNGTIALVLGAVAVIPAGFVIGPAAAVLPLLAVTLPMANAWRDWTDVRKPVIKSAAAIEKLLEDATSDEWAELLQFCGNPQDLDACLQAGLIAGRTSGAVKGSLYHAALGHAHNLGKALPAAYTPKAATGFAKPKDLRSWEEDELDDVESEPTAAEVALVAQLCAERVGCTQAIVERAFALRESNKAAATNLLITHAGISDRDYVKAGLPIARLRSIKKWAVAGDLVEPQFLTLPPVVPAAIVDEVTPIVAVEPEVEPVAVAPRFHRVALETAIVEPVEPEPDYEFDIEEYEEEPAKPIAVAPMFFQSNQQRTPIAASVWDTTDLDTIAPADIGNVNQFPVILVVAGQGNGKTCSLAYIFEQLAGRKAMYTPKMDDHRNPAIQQVYDLRFGYNPVTNRAAWYGTPESFDNSPMMDLDWYLDHSRNKFGSALDFIHAANQTAVNRTASGTKKGRSMWRVFYDEAAVTYRAGFNRVVVDGVSLGSKGRQECQEFIAANLIPAIFNWRGAGVQLFIGCQSETVESIGLKGCAEARDEAWHLYPGLKAIEVAKKCKQSKLAAFLQRAVDDDYAIAILEKEEKQFKIIRMPKLAELSRFDPIIEDDDVLEEAIAVTPEPVQQAIELDDVWGDADAAEDAVIETAAAPDIDAIKTRIARVMAMPGLTDDEKLDLIETLTK